MNTRRWRPPGAARRRAHRVSWCCAKGCVRRRQSRAAQREMLDDPELHSSVDACTNSANLDANVGDVLRR